MKTTGTTAMVLAIVCLGGCSGRTESEVVSASAVEPIGSTSLTSLSGVTLVPATPEKSLPTQAAGTNRSGELTPFRNPFAPPTEPPPPPIVEEPEPEPELPPEPEPVQEIRSNRTPPPVRLIGFMNIDEPKVLVSFRDELETLAIGDMLDEMQVVKIESPQLTMRFDDEEIKLSLFEQTWKHKKGRSSVGNVRGTPRPGPTRTLRSTNAVPVRASAPSVIPGFGPNEGKAPGIKPALPSGSTPRTPSGVGELPSLPGLTAGDEFGSSRLPGAPGSL